MINLRPPVTICGKKCYSFVEQDYFTSMWNTFSVCLFRSTEFTEAISLALHGLENIFGFTEFLSTSIVQICLQYCKVASKVFARQ